MDMKLPRDADNFDVWCERCQKRHRYHTFTQEDYDRIVADSVKAMTDAIDARMLDTLPKDFGK